VSTSPKPSKNLTKKGKRLGRPPKYAALLSPPTSPQPPRAPRARRGRPKKETLTTLEIIYSELGKRPGFAKQLTEELARLDQPADVRTVRTVASTKKHLARIQKRRQTLTAIDAISTKRKTS